MKGMRKISRGTGFSGVLAYCLEGEKGEIGHGKLIGGTMAGTTKIKLSSEFRAVSALRPDIEKPVWHSSLRMPKGEDVTDDKWREIIVDYMEAMGWPASVQYAAFKHTDEHVHIVANRVLIDSTVYLGQNENLKSTRVIGELEKRHGLTLTKGPDVDENGKIVMPETSALKKREIEKALRTGDKPARLVLQDLVRDAMKNRPSVVQFMERLEVAGVDVLPNIASTGRMNGFSFRYGGLKFSGSELGTAFKWSALQKEVSYDEDRDSKELAGRRDAEQRRRENDAAAAAAAELAQGDRADRITADSGGAAGRRDSAASPGATRNSEVVGVDRSPAESDRGSTAAKREKGDSDAGGSARLDLVARGTEGARTIEQAAQPAAQKDVAAKVAAWRQQHAGLDARAYRLTMKDRVLTGGKDRSHNLGKSSDPKVEEAFYDAAAVEKMIPKLRAKNARGFDIYITPIEPSFHYIVIDDMKPGALDDMRREGYQPCLVQSSSADNLQAVIKVRRDGRKDEQQIANRLVVDLNEKYGDPKFSGVVHPFRMAGFSNKKPGRKNAFTRVLEALGALCGKATGLLSSLRQQIDSEAATKAAATKKAERVAKIDTPTNHATHGPLREYQQRAQWLTKGKLVVDWSAVDFGVACEMLKRGFDRDDIAKALLAGSPSLADRHSDEDAYLRKTVDAAILKVGPSAPGQASDDLKI